ncbi:MAG: hypothetical protein KBA66_00515 [Leptospiraceae bacterium]|nr:hypothetical protein [Leptospiraceae bacterium]
MIFRRFYWFILFLLISCSYADERLSFKYFAKYRPKDSFQINETIAITPFQDLRGNKIKENSNYNLLPLVLWTNFETDRPEHSFLVLIFRPREDIPKAIQEEFQSRGIFKDILMTERKNPVKSEYYIEGKIISTNRKGKRFSYGLSFLSIYAFGLGLPKRLSVDEISIELILIESKTKRHLLKKEYKKNTEYSYTLEKSYNIMANELIPEIVEECITVIKNAKGLK